MDNVVKRGSVIELTDTEDKTYYGSVIDFKMLLNDDDGKYYAFILIEEIEEGNTSSEHYGHACIAVDNIKSIKVNENLTNKLPINHAHQNSSPSTSLNPHIW